MGNMGTFGGNDDEPRVEPLECSYKDYISWIIANDLRLALSEKTDRAGTKVKTLATKLPERSHETLHALRTRILQCLRSDLDNIRYK